MSVSRLGAEASELAQDEEAAGLVAMPVRRPSSAQRERRAAILRAAIALLDARNYEQIQVRDIAEAAGVAMATLYRYYPSKEQLYANAVVAWGAPFDAKVRTRGQARSDEARLRATVRSSLRGIERHPRLHRLMVALEGGTDRIARDLIREFGDRYQVTLAEAMPSIDPRDAAMLAKLVVGLQGLLLQRWSSGDLEMRQVVQEIEETIGMMFRAPRASTARAEAGR